MPPRISNKTPIFMLCILCLLFRFAYFLVEVPTVRMIEHAACQQQLGRAGPDPPDETTCKGHAVQEQVSMIIGWKMSFDAAPGLLSILYFGNIADRHGHAFVLSLCCLGYLFALLWIAATCYFHDIFQVTAVLFSSAFLLVGGGPLVFSAVSVSLVTSLAGTESRAKYLFLLAAMPHFDKLISPPIATALMKQDLFLPSLAASVVLLICIAILADKGLLSPQGEPLLGTNNTRSHVASATATRPGFFPSHSEDEGLPDTNPVCQGAFFAQPARRLRGVTSFLYREPILGLCFFAFFLKSNAMASEGFVFQYLSEKFGWPLRDTTILRFALSFGAVISTLIIGPLVSSTLTRRATQPATINLIMIHSSLLLLVVCFIVAWQARSSAIFILSMLGAGFGEGLEPALQGLMSVSAVGGGSTRLFGLAYMFSLLGDMTGGPLMSGLVSIGRSQNHVSGGYCYLASSIIFGTIAIVIGAAQSVRRESAEWVP